MVANARLLLPVCYLATLLGGIACYPAIASEKVLYSFQGGSDGIAPYGALISDSANNLYGTTAGGGGGSGCNNGSSGCGTLFKLSPDGAETVLYTFQGGSDGAFPRASLIVDSAGNYYGMTSLGGSSDAGTVFRLAPDGTETVLYAFQGGSDGALPLSSLLMDGKGDFYGTTTWGGSFNGSQCMTDGCGTVFELKADGTKVTLYAFQGGNDGAQPFAGLTRGPDGNFYGTTTQGGVNCDGSTVGCGTVFKLTPSGAETVFYAFQGGSDGYQPEAGLIVDKAGNFYGTTNAGGSCPSNPSFGCGTVYTISPTGAETVLYSFQGGNDGEYPLTAGVIMDKSGNLYGTTYFGGGTGCAKTGHIGCGTVFKLAPDGTETVLFAFKSGHKGRLRGDFPAASLLLKSGILYGTASEGGTNKDGVVFSVKK